MQHAGSSVPRPNKDLRGYRRVRLAPGATRTVRFVLPASSIRYWDADADRWVVESGQLKLQVGASSADIRVETTIRVSP